MSSNLNERLPAGARHATAPVTTERRQQASHAFVIEGDVDSVFGLLDPVSERDWVEDWDPVPVYPAQLSRSAGTVFTLHRDGRTAVWTVLTHDPDRHVAEYLVTEFGYQHRWISVSCRACAARQTQVSVNYVTTALSATGQRDLGRYGEAFLHAWQGPVQSAVNRLAG